MRQQFKAVLPMVESILRGLKQTPGLEGPLASEIWDQGDAVGAWRGARLAAVVFPTADTLKRVRRQALNAKILGNRETLGPLASHEVLRRWNLCRVNAAMLCPLLFFPRPRGGSYAVCLVPLPFPSATNVP